MRVLQIEDLTGISYIHVCRWQYDGIEQLYYSGKVKTNISEIVDNLGSFRNYVAEDWFGVDVDCGIGDYDENEADALIGAEILSTDRAVLSLPKSYSKYGKPTRLLIRNHGAGGVVTENSAQSHGGVIDDTILANGYAILKVNGLPKAKQNLNYIAKGGDHFGGELFLRCIAKAYKYVVDNYNIARDGVLIWGGSMGGLATINLINSGILPIKAAALDAPVLDFYNDAYISDTWAQGTQKYGNAAAIAWVYNFKNCNFDNGTFTLDGSDYISFASASVEQKKSLFELNSNRIYGYNPFNTGKFDVGDNNGIKMPCPIKIWHGKGDRTNLIVYSRQYVEMLKTGGTITGLRVVDTDTHVVGGIVTDKNGNDISVTLNEIANVSPYWAEQLLWLKRFD